MATIKEIAQKAGVSVATVSRVLNADATLSVSASTRDKVFQAAQELNYSKTNPKEKDIKGQVVLTYWYTKELGMTDLYFHALMWAAETDLKANGYQVIRVVYNEEEPEQFKADGIIAIGAFDESQLQSLQRSGKPLVVVNQDTLAQGVSCVVSDYDSPVKQILQAFEEKGLTDIGFIGGHSNSDHEEDPRTVAFRKYRFQQRGLPPTNMWQGDFSMASGYQVMNQIIADAGEQLPSAFFVASDTMAIGALKALAEHQIAVPERVSVVGFGNLSVGEFTTPSLSTVSLSKRQMGSNAVQLLLMMMAGMMTQPIKLVVGAQLTWRQSSR